MASSEVCHARIAEKSSTFRGRRAWPVSIDFRKLLRAQDALWNCRIGLFIKKGRSRLDFAPSRIGDVEFRNPELWHLSVEL
jgi:hypothetical protein